MWILLSVAFAASDADAEYLAALSSWEGHEWAPALAHAEAALAIDPTHRPARLIRGYALLKLGRHDEAGIVLTGLTDEPVTLAYEGEVRRRANRAWRRYSDRYRRDQVALTVSFPVPVALVERTYEELVPVVGYAGAVDVPVPGPVDVRADVSGPFGRDRVFRVDGPRVGVLAVARLPFGRSVWCGDIALGPVLWAATGGYWADGGQPYLGGRASLGIDVRPTWRLGFRAEAGAAWFPGASAYLDWYALPVDARLLTTLWLGK